MVNVQAVDQLGLCQEPSLCMLLQEMLSGFMTKVKNESVAKAEAAVDKFIAQKITDLRQKLSDKQKEYCSHTEDALRVKAQSKHTLVRWRPSVLLLAAMLDLIQCKLECVMQSFDLYIAGWLHVELADCCYHFHVSTHLGP